MDKYAHTITIILHSHNVCGAINDGEDQGDVSRRSIIATSNRFSGNGELSQNNLSCGGGIGVSDGSVGSRRPIEASNRMRLDPLI